MTQQEHRQDGIQRLIADANGASVTSDHLTNDSGLLSRALLSGQPIVDYLVDAEQPHHIFFNRVEAVQRDGEDCLGEWSKKRRNVLVLTDRRVVLISSNGETDRVEAIPYFLTEGASLRTVGKKLEVTIESAVAVYSFSLAKDSAETRELQAATDHVNLHVDRVSQRRAVPEEQRQFRANTAAEDDLWPNSVEERVAAAESKID